MGPLLPITSSVTCYIFTPDYVACYFLSSNHRGGSPELSEACINLTCMSSLTVIAKATGLRDSAGATSLTWLTFLDRTQSIGEQASGR